MRTSLLHVAGQRRELRARVHALPELGEGMVEGYASVFGVTFTEGSSLFRRKVQIEKGAFAASLEAHDSFPLMWEHDWDAGPVGHTTEAEEDDKGLHFQSQMYLDNERGRALWRSMEAKALREWSIGFYPEKWRVEKLKGDDDEESEDDEKVTIYTQIDLAELSSVVRGANPATETIGAWGRIDDIARTGLVVTEVVIDGVRYNSGTLGGGLTVSQIEVDGTNYWAVPMCTSASTNGGHAPERDEKPQEKPLVPGAERLLQRDSFRRVWQRTGSEPA